METSLGFQPQIYNILAIAAALLLVLVTLGVAYLTAAEWRDRRRRQQEQSPRRRK
ncbi:MAG: hypothetical protein HC886_06390 [Leptolyngbyaceae cyanobacterium SM1_1_3]|nr:hypothetical protein [Leptolyngbyaceae cyanobacterium SM1_1_3]NJN03524.1 hypothetical protein [Leptolyngbyaceae cyanobacterium RM1_1_2]NJO10257.1 hypothetical protein [Leptolyngbyaceae cyanobacterium SL_1_1]